MAEMSDLDLLVEAVLSGGRYRAVNPELVRRIGERELAVRKSFKEAVKATRSRLHQVGGAYQEKPIDYGAYAQMLEGLPDDLADPTVRAFCTRLLAEHTSTRERLSIMESFYETLLKPLQPITSIADLACGLNPLALPWMPVSPETRYYACDIYSDMLSFIRLFFDHFSQPIQVDLCDLTDFILPEPVQVALLLKTIPCLEHLDRDIGRKLITSLPAEHIIVSFPAHSLGGRSKGMPATYETRFIEMVSGTGWQVERHLFKTELVFVLHRS